MIEKGGCGLPFLWLYSMVRQICTTSVLPEGGLSAAKTRLEGHGDVQGGSRQAFAALSPPPLQTAQIVRTMRYIGRCLVVPGLVNSLPRSPQTINNRASNPLQMKPVIMGVMLLSKY
jgi:hypothetical protein